jgi:hypothetical protein
MPSIPGFGTGMGGRSDTVSRWKPEEFRKAREEWDPRLVAAIAAYGNGKAASDNAAKLLIDLLQAPATSAPAPSATPGNPPAAVPPLASAPPVPSPAAPPAAPPANGPAELPKDEQGNMFVPPGVTVVLSEPMLIPPDIAEKLNAKPGATFPAGMSLPAGFKFAPGYQLPAGTKITGLAQPPAGAPPAAPAPGAAAPNAGPPQLTTDAQGFTIIPPGVTVTFTEPYPIPPAIAQQLGLPAEMKEMPAGFSLPPGFRIPPGVQLPASVKISAMQLPPGRPPVQIAPALPPTEVQVVEAVVLALGANKTETARSALRKLLKGEMRTAAPEELVSGFAAQAMLIHPTEKEEAGLIAAAANPSVIRKGVIPAGLQAALLNALDQKATSKMRIALVDSINKPTATGDQRKAVMAMLAKPRAENLPAQARLFKNPKLEEAVKKSLFEQFARYSSAAIDQVLQTAPSNTAPTAPVTPDPAAAPAAADPAAPPVAAAPPIKHLDAKSLQAVIEGVWGEDVAERLKADGARSDEFADFAAQLPLAITMPVTEARATLLGIVRDNWVEGPSALAMGGSLGERLRDPGTLFVVKRSPRMEKPVEKPKKEGDDAPAQPRQSRNRSGRPVDEKKEKERKEKKEKEEKAHYEWMAASEEFAHALSDRFYAAAQAGGGQQHKITQETSETPTTVASKKLEPVHLRFPLKLHEGARITAEYHVCLPEDLPEGLKGVKTLPLIVHYVRMEDVSSFPKVNSTYLAQLKGVSSHVRSGSRWLDWTGPGVANGMSRTVDVFIKRNGEAAAPAEGGKAKADDAIPIVTEILVIEVPAFRAPRDNEE